MRAATFSDFPERNSAIVALMLGTGIRRAECAALRVEDVQIDADGSGVVIVRNAKRVRGRDVHQRMVAFDKHTGAYVRAWLDKLGAATGPLWPSYRFMNKTHESLTTEGIYKVVRALIDSAGSTGVIIGCHDLRRLFITYYRRNRRGDAYDNLLSKQVGHSSSKTTDIYDLSDVDDIREALISPLALLQNNVA